MTGERVPLSKCYGCGAPLDGRDALPGEVDLADSVSICMYCGAIGILDKHDRLRRPTPRQLDETLADAEFRAMWVQAMRARAYLMAAGHAHLRYVREGSPSDN